VLELHQFSNLIEHVVNNMVMRWILTLWIGLTVIMMASCGAQATASLSPTPPGPLAVQLPAPQEHGEMSLEEAIAGRRSLRTFASRTLTREELSQLLWAAQGLTDPRGFRAAPSAGALYPLELYVVSVDGFYHYLPQSHELEILDTQDLRSQVWEVGLKQNALRDAPAVFVITAVYRRTAEKYGERATRYVHLEAGHAAQNLLLQAVTLGLGGVPIGAFHDEPLQAALSLPEDHAPLYLLAVGEPAPE
jgi:SagB-type dehydrogenase family enzyme